METMLAPLIFAAGLGQLGVLVLLPLVPITLGWQKELQVLPRLHRQMFWVYSGYVALSIAAFAVLSIFNARELASGSSLGRGVCAYVALFWGIRLGMQAVFDVKEHLTGSWLKVAYIGLTAMFAGLTIVYGWAALTWNVAGRV